MKDEDLYLYEFPDHARYIAHILVGWGEVIFNMVVAAGPGHISFMRVQELVWNIRTDSVRVEVLSALLLEIAHAYGAEKEAQRAIQAAKAALKVRNRYAHSNFHKATDDGVPHLMRHDWSRDYKLVSTDADIGEKVTIETLKADSEKILKAVKLLNVLEERLRDVREEHDDLRLRLAEAVGRIPKGSADKAREESRRAKRPPNPQTKQSDRDQ